MTLLEEYRRRAAEAADEAEAATISGVKERFLHVAATWRAAAERVERSLARREAQLGRHRTQ